MTAPGPVTKLQRSFAYRLSKWFPSEMLRWMDLVSTELDGGGGIVNSVAGTAPIVSSGGVNPNISLNPIANANVAAGAAIDPAKLSNSAAPNGDVLSLVAGVPTWSLPSSTAFTPTTPAAWNPAPTTVGGALDELILNRNVYIFRPAEPAPSGNVFATWPALYAALQADPGRGKTILFDDALAAVAIPVGAYDFGEGCLFRGILPAINSASPNRVQVTCPNGVTFTSPLYEVSDIQLTYSGVGALMTIPGDARNRVFYLTRNGRTNSTGAGGRIFDVPAAAIWNTVLLDLATIVVAGGGFFAVVAAAATQFALRAVESGSTAIRVPANCLSGLAGPTYQFISDIPGNIVLAQASMPGGLITVGPQNATNVKVTSLTDANNSVTFGTNANDGGINVFDMTPSVARTITLTSPTIKGTIVKIANLGVVDITMTYSTALATPAQQSYIGPLSSLEVIWNGTAWDVMKPQLQKGSAALVNGVSAAIPADVTGGAIGIAIMTAWNGVSAGARIGDLVNGTKAGGGSFKIHSVTAASGADLATDQGTYMWHLQVS